MSTASLAGRVAIVTGAAEGLGRAEAVALAARGADVVLADVGDASGTAAEIEALGRRARVVTGDIRDWDLSRRLVDEALGLGPLGIVVNNAGIVRDAMIFSMPAASWSDVVDVHLTGHAALTSAVTAHWRERSKATGEPVDGRIVNTSSEAALTGSPGQPNYAAAKAGIVALTMATARAMAKHGVTANAICPRARTGMTRDVFGDDASDGDLLAPERVARFVAFLASPAAASITGRTFVVYGEAVGLVSAPRIEAAFDALGDAEPDDRLAAEIARHVAAAPGGGTASDLAAFGVRAGVAG